MAGAASQAGDADYSRAPGLTSGLQGHVNVLRGALLLVPQWQCISSFVFYIILRATRLLNKLLEQGYVKERLKSSLRKFYDRYGDLSK